MHVSPRSLRDAADGFHRLVDRVNQLPRIDTGSLTAGLVGSAIGAALADTAAASRQANAAVVGRLDAIAGLLSDTVASYSDTDDATAAKLAEVAGGLRASANPDTGAAGVPGPGGGDVGVGSSISV